MPNGKPAHMQKEFLNYVSFHYVTADMGLLYKKLIYNVPWWPSTSQLPNGVDAR